MRTTLIILAVAVGKLLCRLGRHIGGKDERIRMGIIYSYNSSYDCLRGFNLHPFS